MPCAAAIWVRRAAILEEQLTRGRPVKAAKQMEEGRLPAAAGTHHGWRLPGGDIQVDTVDRAHQSSFPAVLLAQPAGAQDARVIDAAHDGSFHSTVMPLVSAIAVKPENRHLLSL